VYIRDKVLSLEEIEEAKTLYDSLEKKKVFQYYNLFDLYRADIPEPLDQYSFYKTLLRYSGLETHIGAPYFLKYVPGSFTRVHPDNDSKFTTVTLIESENLVGGDSIVIAPYDKGKTPSRPANEICIRNERETKTPPYGHDIVMDVIPFKDGDTLSYGPTLQHGVTMVHKGYRIVLVIWFK